MAIINGRARVGVRVVVGPSPSPSYLLDTYGGAAAAYSLRKLSSTYSGNAIRVRRSSDNTETNIGFDGSGNLDQAALTTFVGAGNGFVTTWYDQSGNGKNATNTTAIRQPKIVNSGSILLKNGKPNINFTSQTLNIGTSLNISSTSFMSFLGNSSSTGSPSAAIITYQSNPVDNPELRFGLGDGQNSYWNGGYVTYTGAAGFLTNKIFNMIIQSGITVNIYGNNTLSATGTRTGTWNTGVFNFSLGGYHSLGLYRDGDCQEYILWNSDQSSNRSGINSNINSYYSIY
jgi:hypothetical protein